ncbi:DUF402 domain-containing protein [Chungangia koreensis]|uniref:DUF402 domain-containing protein n=1 Tax=Chungangia koreensis TaxID=752657 RepID=A0ABV8X1B8_9LACT
MVTMKYGSRSDWKRILERRYIESFVEEKSFKGHLTLLQMLKVTEPLHVTYGNTSLCIVDDGYYWMQYFPEKGHYSVTTMLDSEGHIIQWYIDICLRVGYNPDKGPWLDDLILDIVVLPDGQLIELDVDEFMIAKSENLLSESEVELATHEFNRLIEEISQQRFSLLTETARHFEELKKKLTSS